MCCFYDKEIEIYTYSNAKDEHKINRKKYTLVVKNEPIMVDVQPYSSEKAKIDYGYNIVCTKRIFMDIVPEVIESTVIKYKEQFYSIEKIIEWEDYLELMILERDDITKLIIQEGDDISG